MSVSSIEEAKRRAWRTGLIMGGGKVKLPKRCVANTLQVLALHPAWQGVLAFDAFAETVVCLREPPAREQDRPAETVLGDWSDEHTTRTAAWISSECGFEPSSDMVEQAVATIARKRVVHPVREYLEQLTWDGRQRLPEFLATYFGATKSPYSAAIGEKWMISAVARIFKPGCQVDNMLVLESEQQGIGKSTALHTLGGKWYADTGVTVGEKDSYQALRRVWIYEFAELSAIRGREAERVKNFISSRQDHYRPSYGRRTRDFPRQVVFAGSTNESTYLVDRTGNRRFWPVRCTNVNVAALAADRDQLWAEAVARFRNGEPWHADSADLVKLCEAEQADRQAPDDWRPVVADWLKHPTLPDGAHERRLLDTATGVTTHEVLLGAIGMRAADLNNAHSTRAGRVLRELGFEPSPNPVRRNGDRVRVYLRAADTTDTTENAGCAGPGVPLNQQQLGFK